MTGDHEVWRGHTLLGCGMEIGNIDTLSVSITAVLAAALVTTCWEASR